MDKAGKRNGEMTNALNLVGEHNGKIGLGELYYNIPYRNMMLRCGLR
jgi:hypothetical protein